MLVVNLKAIRDFLSDCGIKQKKVADRAGIDEAKLCKMLQGKRKIEASEYANICRAIGVPMDTFMEQKENAG